MTDDIPYTVVPQITPFNVGVFLLNFNNRKDGLALGEAFCKDFDILNLSIQRGCNVTALKLIAREYLGKNA